MIALSTLKLKSGSHKSPEQGMCIMEAVAYFAKESHSDAPVCACPVLSSYLRILNDRFSDSERQLLKPYIKQLIGTRDGNSQKRANILSWASIVKFTPHCLELVGLHDNAKALKNLNKYDWSAARSAANAAYSAAYSAANAANAAYSAAYSAANAASAARSAANAAYNAAYSAANAADSAANAAYSAADSDKDAARMIVVKMALKALDQALAVK